MKRPFKIAVSAAAVSLLIFGMAFVTLPLPGTVPILMYHVIDSKERASEEKNVVSQKSFARQMAFLKFFGYRVISLDDFYEMKIGKRKPLGKEIVLTFDDADYTLDTKAYPVLSHYAFPVTIFAISEGAKRGINGSMTADTLKKLLKSSWIQVESHTKTHPSLSKMTDDQIEEELVGSKQDLEEMLGVPVRYLSYPNGDLDSRVTRIAERAGYRLAFTTSYRKLKTLEEGPYSLGRVKISRTSDNPIVFWFKISGIYHVFKRERHHLKNLLAK